MVLHHRTKALFPCWALSSFTTRYSDSHETYYIIFLRLLSNVSNGILRCCLLMILNSLHCRYRSEVSIYVFYSALNWNWNFTVENRLNRKWNFRSDKVKFGLCWVEVNVFNDNTLYSVIAMIIESLNFLWLAKRSWFQADYLNIKNLLSICRQLPVPYNKANGGATTSIPLPATVLVTRRSTPDKRSLPVPNGQSGIAKYPSGTPSSESSRPNSPPDFKSGIRWVNEKAFILIYWKINKESSPQLGFNLIANYRQVPTTFKITMERRRIMKLRSQHSSSKTEPQSIRCSTNSSFSTKIKIGQNHRSEQAQAVASHQHEVTRASAWITTLICRLHRRARKTTAPKALRKLQSFCHQKQWRSHRGFHLLSLKHLHQRLKRRTKSKRWKLTSRTLQRRWSCRK